MADNKPYDGYISFNEQLSAANAASCQRSAQFLKQATTLCACFVVMLPPVFLNSLNPLLSAQNITLAQLNSTKAWEALLVDASASEWLQATIALLLSGAVIFYFRYLYFIRAVKHVFRLFVDIMQKVFCRNSATSTYTCSQLSAHMFLLLVSVAASVPFAAIFSEPFVVWPGLDNVVYVIAMGSYTSTRFVSLVNVFDSQARLRAYYGQLMAFFFVGGGRRVDFSMVGLTQTGNIQTCEQFLDAVDTDPESMIQLRLHHKILLALALVLGDVLLIPSLLAVLATFIPASCQGWQKVTGANIGSAQDYRNTLSIVIGITSEIPTLFFYARSISMVWVELFRLGYMLRGVKEWCLHMLLLIPVAAYAAHATSQGFEVAAVEEAVDYSYLGEDLQKAVPIATSGAITFLVMAHLLKLMQQRVLRSKANEFATQRNSSGYFANQVRAGDCKEFPRPRRCALFTRQAWQVIFSQASSDGSVDRLREPCAPGHQN